jgi:hypothetical protein
MKSDVAFIGTHAINGAALTETSLEGAVHKPMTDDRADSGEIARMRDLDLEVKDVASKGRARQAVS